MENVKINPTTEKTQNGYEADSTTKEDGKNSMDKMITSDIKEKQFFDKIRTLSNNAGFFSFLVTVLITFVSILVKLVIYSFFCGKYDFLNISRIHIDVFNENAKYNVFLIIAVAILYIFINYIPYRIFNSEDKLGKKFLYFTLLIVISSIILFAILYISEKTMTGNKLKLDYIGLCLIITTFLYFNGFIVGIIGVSGKHDSKQKYYWHKLFSKIAIFICLIIIASYVIIAYLYGYHNAKAQKSYKFIDINQIVLHEDASHFIISDCKINGNSLKIDKTTHKLISKEGIKTNLKEFNDVHFVSLSEEVDH